MKIKNLKFIIYSFLSLTPLSLLAQVNNDLIKDAATGAGLDTSDSALTIPQTVGNIIGALLSFVGTIFFIFIIISGIQWMTAGGNEEKVSKARTRVINASIGLAITVAAYFITWFISRTILGN